MEEGFEITTHVELGAFVGMEGKGWEAPEDEEGVRQQEEQDGPMGEERGLLIWDWGLLIDRRGLMMRLYGGVGARVRTLGEDFMLHDQGVGRVVWEEGFL